MQDKYSGNEFNKLPPFNCFGFNSQEVDREQKLCFGNDAFCKNFSDILFKTREKLYIRLVLVFFLSTFFGVSVFFFANVDREVVYNEIFSTLLNKSENVSLYDLFIRVYPTLIAVLVLFISGLTVFARFASYAYVSLTFIKWGFRIKPFFDILSVSSFALINYIFISGIKALSLIIFAAEICKFSDISVRDIQKTIRPANIFPYIIVCFIYLLLETILEFWYLSAVSI